MRARIETRKNNPRLLNTRNRRKIMSKWDQYPKLKGNWLWVSASQIEKFLACPRMWWWEYRLERDKRLKPPKTKALEIGVQHATELEEYLKGERSEDDLMDLAKKGIHLLPPVGSNIRVEAPWHIDIHRGKAPFAIPDEYDGVRILGAIDLLDLNAVNDGWIFIDDHKTCKNLKWAKKGENISSDIQMNLYGFWVSRVAPRLGLLPGGKMVRLGWINYPKSDDPAHRVNGVMSRDANIRVITERVFPAIEGMLDFAAAQEQDGVPANPDICKSHFGGCWHGVKASHCNRGTSGADSAPQPTGFAQLFEGDPNEPVPELTTEVNNFASDEGYVPSTEDILSTEGRKAFDRILAGNAEEETFHMDNIEQVTDDPVFEEAPENFEDRPLDRLNLPTRAYNKLIEHGVKWASELLGYTRERLLDMKGLGAKTVDDTMEIIEELRAEAQSAQDNDVVQKDLSEQVHEQGEPSPEPEPKKRPTQGGLASLHGKPPGPPAPSEAAPWEKSSKEKEAREARKQDNLRRFKDADQSPVIPAYALCIDSIPVGTTDYTDLDRFFEACCMVYQAQHQQRPEATPYKEGMVKVREFATAVLEGNPPEKLAMLGYARSEDFEIHPYVVLRTHSDADKYLGALFRYHATATIQGVR